MAREKNQENGKKKKKGNKKKTITKITNSSYSPTTTTKSHFYEFALHTQNLYAFYKNAHIYWKKYVYILCYYICTYINIFIHIQKLEKIGKNDSRSFVKMSDLLVHF